MFETWLSLSKKIVQFAIAESEKQQKIKSRKKQKISDNKENVSTTPALNESGFKKPDVDYVNL